MLESAQGWLGIPGKQTCRREGKKGDAAAWSEAEKRSLNVDEVKCLGTREKQSHEKLKWKTRGKKSSKSVTSIRTAKLSDTKRLISLKNINAFPQYKNQFFSGKKITKQFNFILEFLLWENTMIIIFWNTEREQVISGKAILIARWSTLNPRCH